MGQKDKPCLPLWVLNSPMGTSLPLELPTQTLSQATVKVCWLSAAKLMALAGLSSSLAVGHRAPTVLCHVGLSNMAVGFMEVFESARKAEVTLI